ncbi:short-chain dehydrogenase reductase protein [Rutstroemia sp. NJR-2017a BBW]|nr:short-chain dehydrogenase reductase protein [Rutstroemia sp. NJR-2017a BBW]
MLTTDLTGHLALITGATGGIGQATALTLANLGCSIAVHYNSASTTAHSLVHQLLEKGVRASAFQADLTSYSAVRTLHHSVVTQMGHPSILFNNAGLISGPNRATDISEIDISDFENTWRANCGSAFLLTQLCMPAIVEKRWGRIIFCSSVAGFTGGVVGPHYASSKSALHGLVHWLAGVYADRGITVNGVAPALIGGTGMLPGSGEELAKKIPIGRLGTPDEIAATVEWMVKTGA